jgi:Outer membrane protein beta-barrel domain
MADKNFEQRVSEQMDDFKITPSAPVWQHIEAQLRKDKRRRWFFYMITLAALLGGGLYWYENSQSGKETVATKNDFKQQMIAEVPEVSAQEKQNKDELPDTDKKNTEKEKSIPSQNQASIPKKEKAVTSLVVGEEQKTNSSQIKNLLVTKTSAQISKPVHVSQVNNQSSVKEQKAKMQLQNVKTESKAEVILMANEKKETTLPVEIKQQTNIPRVTNQTAALNQNKNTDTPVTPIDTAQQKINKEEATEQAVKKDTVSVSAVQTSALKKKKWQSGFELSAGVSHIRKTPLPLTSDRTSEAVTSPFFGGTAGAPGPNPSGVVINDYSVKNGLNLNAGYLLRKQLNKKLFFATGIQYQYSSFSVENKIRVDSFFAANASFVTVDQRSVDTTYRFHYITVPTELQWQLASSSKGSFMLHAGIRHFFKLSSTKAVPDFLVNTSPSARFKQPSTFFYQPVVSIAPVYERNQKNGSLQLGWYIHFGLSNVYRYTNENFWWQTGLRFQYFFSKKKQ